RGRAILQKATPLPVSCSDVVRNAQIWNISIKSYKQFSQLMTRNEANGRRTLTKVRGLRGAFIKVEDRSRRYRPLVKEMRCWPRPNLDAPPGYGPFDDVTPRPKRRTVTSTPRRRRTRKRARQSRSGRSTAKKGYCEVCHVTYQGLVLHLSSQGHREKARSPDKYARIDNLINHGDSLQAFAQRVARRRGATN
ncbi:hypothetical protein QZH41_016759, partial [Actinostola sp. cb2023]